MILGILGLLLVLSCAGWMIGVPYIETRYAEIQMKRQLEADLRIPIERVDLVRHGDGYRGTVTPMRGGKMIIILTPNPDGSMRYFVR
jgi:hypothetical protein